MYLYFQADIKVNWFLYKLSINNRSYCDIDIFNLLYDCEQIIDYLKIINDQFLIFKYSVSAFSLPRTETSTDRC